MAATAAGYGLKATTCSLVASADVVRASAASNGFKAYGLRLKVEGGVVKLRLNYRVEVEIEVEVLRRRCKAEA